MDFNSQNIKENNISIDFSNNNLVNSINYNNLNQLYNTAQFNKIDNLEPKFNEVF